MIIENLNVHEYCSNCDMFKPEFTHDTSRYYTGEVAHYVTISCEHHAVCRRRTAAVIEELKNNEKI